MDDPKQRPADEDGPGADENPPAETSEEEQSLSDTEADIDSFFGSDDSPGYRAKG
jgi:hypothetical protein